MPGYISHAIMGEELYNEAIKNSNILKIPINKNELKSYSLGVDLAALSKKTIKDPNNYYTKDFFLYLIKYIKDNKLNANSNIIALLYGHIAHYFLDTNTHPLIYYIELSCKKVSPITNHDLVEGYISSYLSQKNLNKDIMDIPPKYFNQINLSDQVVSQTLNNVYGKIYSDYEIIKSYKKVMNTFTNIETIIKSGLITKELLIKISKFNHFLEKNNLSKEEIINTTHETFTNPITGKKQNDSFDDLYYKSIEMTLNAILEVNNYLYNNNSINNLEKVFTDLSYDTGVSCSLGKKFVYTRKK